MTKEEFEQALLQVLSKSQEQKGIPQRRTCKDCLFLSSYITICYDEDDDEDYEETVYSCKLCKVHPLAKWDALRGKYGELKDLNKDGLCPLFVEG